MPSLQSLYEGGLCHLTHKSGSCLLLVIYHFGIYSDVLLLSLMRPHTFPRRHRHREQEPTFIATQTPDVLSRLLPDTITLDLDTCDVDDTAAQITLAVRSTQAMALCPLCTTPAQRIHSH